MEKRNEKIMDLGKKETSVIYGGTHSPGRDESYECGYALGYFFAWISSYIGTNSSRYGIAFK